MEILAFGFNPRICDRRRGADAFQRGLGLQRCCKPDARCYSKVTQGAGGVPGWAIDCRAGCTRASDGDERSRNMLDTKGLNNLTRDSGSLAVRSRVARGWFLPLGRTCRRRHACLRKQASVFT